MFTFSSCREATWRCRWAQGRKWAWRSCVGQVRAGSGPTAARSSCGTVCTSRCSRCALDPLSQRRWGTLKPLPAGRLPAMTTDHTLTMIRVNMTSVWHFIVTLTHPKSARVWHVLTWDHAMPLPSLPSTLNPLPPQHLQTTPTNHKSYMLKWKCEISHFVKALNFSVISWSYCFTQGFHEITKFPSHFT